MNICIGMSTTLNSVYDVIEALCRWRGFTTKELAAQSSIKYTTLATILQRRPEKIAAKNLELIAQVFETEWYMLLGRDEEPDALDKYSGRNINGLRVSALMDEETIKRVLESIIGEEYRKILDRIYDSRESQTRDRLNFANPIYGNHTPLAHKAVHSEIRAKFDACVDLVFDNFNEAGVVEAMRYILALSQDPRYCKSASFNAENEDAQNLEDMP